jgi:ABC-type lipoprotein release transport system permease subunit
MQGPRLPTLAWRNIWRNRRRTLITLFSIAFGTLLAVLFTGLGDESYSAMIDHAARLGGGHVIVQDQGYVELPSLERTVQATPAAIETIEQQPEVRRVVPRVAGGVMLSSSTNNLGAGVIGIDPTREDDSTFGLVDAISEGQMFTSPDDEGIILGKVLADNLDVELGKKVVYTVTDKTGEITNGLARVTGIIETGATEIDAGTVLLPINQFRKLLGYGPDEVTQLAVFVTDHRDSASVAARLSGPLAAEQPNLAALPWYEAQRELAAFITMKETGAMVFEIIVTILIAAGIFNTLFVSVMERMRELGILAAIGFSSRQLFALVIWESLWLGLCGIVAGVLLTAGPYWYFSTVGFDMSVALGDQAGGGAQISGVTMSPILYVGLYPIHALYIAIAIVVATLAAGLYPAFKAGRVQPVEAIRVV